MAESPGILSGELGLIGLFDLGQLLMLNRATGVLAITQENRRGSLMFRDGQLVNAVDDQRKQGEEAAYRLFAWKFGRFEFRAGEFEGDATISGGTESIMLEAARRIDEATPAAGGEDVSQTAKLIEHQSQFDQLRDEFSRLGRELSTETRRAPDWIDPWLGMMHMPADRLLARPGSRPRIFVHGAWHPTGDADAPMDSDVYEDLRSRMFEGSSEDEPDAPIRRRVVRHRDRSFAVTLVRGPKECLWIAPAVAAAVSGEPVEGAFDELDAVFAQPSVMLLVAASHLDAVHVLLRALVVRLCESRALSIMVVSDDPLLPPPENMGVVLPARPRDVHTVLQSARPGAIAIDALCSLGPPMLAALTAAPIVIAAVVASDAEAIVPRWLARFEAADLPRAQSLVDSTSMAIALAGPKSPGGILTFGVRRVARAASPAQPDPFGPVDLLR